MNRYRRAWMIVVTVIVLAAVPLHAEPVRIGSKPFTESVILGELARLTVRETGAASTHRRQLGGTRILWRALRQGEIDVYPEYTGTLSHELLRDVAADADIATLRQRLQPLGIGITDALGFNNTYAIGMRANRAEELAITRISDLSKHPDLRFGFSNEFMDRQDGWPGLRERYALPQQQTNGLDHTLAYRALASGAVDAIDLYSTDAEIAYYHLRTLGDDRHYFPRYDAVYLYRLDLSERAPTVVAALRALASSLNAETMRGLNAKVKLDGASEAQVVAELLNISAADSDGGIAQRILRRSREHLQLVAYSLLLAVLVAIPLGIVAAQHRRLGHGVIALTGIAQTVPSLAMFVFMIPIFGIGAGPAVAALFLYSLLPIVRNTHAGLVGIAPELQESAAALGLPRGVRLRRIQLPLALRSILAGIKTAAVINVGTATLAALIGAGGYGQPIVTGIRLDDIGLILQGAVPAAILALLVQGLFEAIERWLTPRGLRLAARQ